MNIFSRLSTLFIFSCLLFTSFTLLAMEPPEPQSSSSSSSEFWNEEKPALVKNLDQKYHEKTIDFWVNDPLAINLKSSDKDDATIRNYCRWKAIAETEVPNGTIIDKKYLQIYINNKNAPQKAASQQPILTGDLENVSLKKYVDAKSSNDIAACEKVLPILVKIYKIHLMPMEKNNDDIQEIEKIWIKLLQLVKKSPKLQGLISLIKILPDSYNRRSKLSQDKPRIPRIVIYIYNGAKAAQDVLNIIYEEFKDIQGSNELPGYNEKVTSLIFFTQGDRDLKGDEYKEYYEEGRVYYDPYLTGEYQNYHLINPNLVGKTISSSSSSSSSSSVSKPDIKKELSKKSKGLKRERDDDKKR